MPYAVAVRIPPGKTEAVRQLFAESLGPRKAEYDDLQRRSGITEEEYWLQSDPEGGLLIVTSNRDQATFVEIMATPQTDFDRWFRDQMQEAFAFEFTGSPEPSTNVSGVGPRKRWD